MHGIGWALFRMRGKTVRKVRTGATLLQTGPLAVHLSSLISHHGSHGDSVGSWLPIQFNMKTGQASRMRWHICFDTLLFYVRRAFLLRCGPNSCNNNFQLFSTLGEYAMFRNS